jgi:molecular chaperone DnaJ
MAKRDYYEVLGIARGAKPSVIKRAFKKLALQYHPDRNRENRKEAEERFKEIAEAYEVLADAEKRQRYDQYGHEGLRGTGFRPFSNVEDIFGFDLFSSIFDELGFAFGGAGRGGRRRGRNVEAELVLEFDEACFGVTKALEVKRQEPCDACEGTGAKRGTTPRTCSTCGGLGEVQQRRGFFAVRTVCPHCRGRGSVIDTPCPDCSGAGRVMKTASIDVHIPAGIEDNVRLRVSGQGELDESRQVRGDLYCYVRVKPHPLFERHNDDVVCRVPITYSQAVLGSEIEVPTLKDGTHKLQVPRGTSSGEVLTLRGLGIPHLNGRGRGDQHVVVVIDVPHKITPRQEELLRELAELDERDVSPERKSFFEKVRDFFTDGRGATD